MVTILSRLRLVVILVASFLAQDVSSFTTISHHKSDCVVKLSSRHHQRFSSRSRRVLLSAFRSNDDDEQQQQKQMEATSNISTRRSILQQVISTSAILSSSSVLLTSKASIANAAMGTLPEFQDTNAIFQGVTIDVTDQSQYDETIQFFTNAFDGMTVLRERGGEGGGFVKDTVS